MFHPTDRLAIFIDGSNLYSAARALQHDMDFRRMLDWFREKSILIRAYYYTAVVEGEEFSPVKPLVDWLDYNGFSVVTKPVKRFTDTAGHSRIKGNMDMEIAVDMLELAPALDHVVLFSGDGDFRRLVQAVQAKGVRVTVISTQKTQPPHIADELRRQADAFLDLNDLMADFGRPKSATAQWAYRPSRPATVRSARAWWPIARRTPAKIRIGGTAPPPPSATLRRGFWSPAWRRAAPGPTAPAVLSRATTPEGCCTTR